MVDFSGSGNWYASPFPDFPVTASFNTSGSLATISIPAVRQTLPLKSTGAFTNSLVHLHILASSTDHDALAGPGYGVSDYGASAYGTGGYGDYFPFFVSFPGTGVLGVPSTSPNPAVTAAFSGESMLWFSASGNGFANIVQSGTGTLNIFSATPSLKSILTLWGSGSLSIPSRIPNITAAPAFDPTPGYGQSPYGSSAYGTGVYGDPASTVIPFAGSGILGTSGTPLETSSPTFQGSGGLAVSGGIMGQSFIPLSGSGSLSTISTAALTQSASFGASGAFSTAGSFVIAQNVPFTGAGVSSAMVSALPTGTAGFMGSGSLAIQGALNETTASSFNGGGALIASASVSTGSTIAVTGTGSLSAAMVGMSQAATFGGTGILAQATSLQFAANVPFTGTGSLSGSPTVKPSVLAVFTGSGTLLEITSVWYANGFCILYIYGNPLRASGSIENGGGLQLYGNPLRVSLETRVLSMV